MARPYGHSPAGRQASTVIPAGLPPSLMRRMITSWILGVFAWILLTLNIISFAHDIHRVLVPQYLTPPSALLRDILYLMITTVMYAPLLFVPALIIGSILGLLIGVVMNTRFRAGAFSTIEAVRRFLRITLIIIWLFMLVVTVVMVYPTFATSVSPIVLPAWVNGLLMIIVTTLVLMWIERRFMRWYIRHASDASPPQQVVQQT